MKLPYSVEDLRDATNDLLGANGLAECYIRPIAFYGYGQLGVSARDNPIETVIMSWPWGTYLGEEALASGIRAKISSWQRIPPNVVPHASKASGVYLNSMLAVNEAQRAGYDEAILLTPEGNVADGPGETIFVVVEGQDLHARSLDRDPARDHARLDHPDRARSRVTRCVEKNLIRSDLYLADEVFMCGTAAEVTPLRSVDDHEIGVGPVTRELQKAYLDTVKGASDRWAQWRELVPSMTRA